MKLKLRLYPSQSFHQYKQKASIHGLVCHAYRHQQEFCFSNYTTASKQIGDSSAYSTHDCSLLGHQYKGLTTPQVSSMLCVSSVWPSLSVCVKIAPCCEFKNPNMKYKMRFVITLSLLEHLLPSSLCLQSFAGESRDTTKSQGLVLVLLPG